MVGIAQSRGNNMCCKCCVCAGAEELRAIAAALGRLPALSIWKVSKTELASVGGVASLNLSTNVKVA